MQDGAVQVAQLHATLAPPALAGDNEVTDMQRPVFIVGCPRSGTTLLYSMLVAAGGFAEYRKETYFYDLLPRFPDLTGHVARERFAAEFLGGYLGKVPGLDVKPFVFDALDRCRCSAEFLPRLMDGIAHAQGMSRWVEATPVHVLHMQVIKRAVPDALFVHVVRDGRDCALSNSAGDGFRHCPGTAAAGWALLRSIGNGSPEPDGPTRMPMLTTASKCDSKI